MLIRSEKYPELLVVGAVKFRDGVAEVTDPSVIDRLRKFASMGVVVPDAPAVEVSEAPAKPAPRRGRPRKSE